SIDGIEETLEDAMVTEQRLRQHAEQFRLLVMSVGDYAIFMLDTDGNIISWNRGAHLIKGYLADEIIGKHFSIFYTPEDRDKYKPDFALQTAKTAGVFRDEAWRVRKDGERFWANVTI